MSNKRMTGHFTATAGLSKINRNVLDIGTISGKSPEQIDLGGVVSTIRAVNRSLALIDQCIASSQLMKSLNAINQVIASSQVVQYMTLANRAVDHFRSAMVQGLADFATIEIPAIWIKRPHNEGTLELPRLAPRVNSSLRNPTQQAITKEFDSEESGYATEKLLLRQFDVLITDRGIRRTSRKYFTDGYYSIAVEKACVYVDSLVRSKSGHSHRFGADLMRQAFSPKKAILKLNKLETISDEDEQTGYMNIFAGVMQGIRNPRSHDFELTDSPEEALEMLVMLNHLMRKLNNSTSGNYHT